MDRELFYYAISLLCHLSLFIFCLLCLYPNKEKKETQNKIKKNKRKGKQNKTKFIIHNSDNFVLLEFS